MPSEANGDRQTPSPKGYGSIVGTDLESDLRALVREDAKVDQIREQLNLGPVTDGDLALSQWRERLSHRYERPGKEWPTPGGLPADMCCEAQAKFGFILHVISDAFSLDDHPELDEACHIVYIALKHLEIDPRSHSAPDRQS
jgi:hypothetical protein